MCLFLRLFFSIFVVCVTSSIHADFRVSEVFPNTLDDAQLEYITIINLWEETLSLSGYTIADKSKKYLIVENILVRVWETAQLLRTKTKHILNNSNEEIFLYNSQWELVDHISYTTSLKSEVLYFWGHDTTSEVIIWEKKEVDVQINTSEPILTHTWSLEAIFELQRPSYITQSWSSDIYICDSWQDECKVNFNLEPSFSWDFKKWDYTCEIDFQWIWESETQKCNPNTVIFPEGNSVVRFSIFRKDSWELQAEKTIEVLFDRSIPSLQEQANISKTAKLALRKPRVIIQSWLTGQGTNFYCIKQPCKFNLDYDTTHSWESCFWDFGPWIASSESTKTRCNPWYVDIPEGIFELGLRVYEKEYPSNKEEIRFYIHNVPIVEENVRKDDYVLTQEDIVPDNTLIDSENLEAKIVLQWRVSKEKTLSWSSLLCRDVDTCYVNLTSEVSWGGTGFEYLWKDNWEIFSQDENPKWSWLEVWEHEVSLEISHWWSPIATQNFYVSVKWEQEKVVNIKKTWEPQVNNIIEPVLFDYKPETIRSKVSKNIFTQNYLVLKYDGLRISWKAPVWSIVELYHWDDMILSWVSDEKWKYRIVSKTFTPWEYNLDTKLTLDWWEEIFIQSQKVASISLEQVWSWQIGKVKKRAATKNSSVNTSAQNPQQFIMSSSEYIEDEKIQEQLSMPMKIFMSVVIVLTAVFGFLHLIYTSVSNISQSITWVYILRFNTKQKICLIL